MFYQDSAHSKVTKGRTVQKCKMNRIYCVQSSMEECKYNVMTHNACFRIRGNITKLKTKKQCSVGIKCLKLNGHDSVGN